MTLKDDKDLNSLLDAYQVKPADMAMQQRILAIPVREPRPWRELLGVLGGWRVAGPAFAFSVSLGICTPLLLGVQDTTSTYAQESVWTVAGLDTTQDWTYE